MIQGDYFIDRTRRSPAKNSRSYSSILFHIERKQREQVTIDRMEHNKMLTEKKHKKIIALVCQKTGISVDDPFLSKSRKKKPIPYAICRMASMYLIRRHTLYSLDEIGACFANQDHSTVINATKAIQNLIDVNDEQVTGIIQFVENALEAEN